MISQRPAEVAERAVPGHWEGDLVIGLQSSAIGTLVERTTRFTMLLHLPPMAGHTSSTRAKNGPALAGHGAEAVRDAIAAKIATLPEQLRKSLTWDQGAEMAQHTQLRIYTGLRSTSAIHGVLGTGYQLYRHQRAIAAVLSEGYRPQLDMASMSSTQWLLLSTAGLAKPSDGRRQSKHSRSYYPQLKQPVLQRLLEPKLTAPV